MVSSLKNRQGYAVSALLLFGSLLLFACSAPQPQVVQTDAAWQASPAAPAVPASATQSSSVFPASSAADAMNADADPVLRSLLESAAQSSTRMAEQELNILQNDAFRFRGWRQHLPYINGGYSLGYFKLFRGDNRGNDEKLSGTYNIGLRYPIFAWGAIGAEKDAARLRETAAMQNAEVVWRYFSIQIRRDYYRAILLKNQIGLKNRQIELELRQQGRISAVNKAGSISDNDTIARGVALRQRRSELQVSITELENLIASIREMTGLATFSAADLPETVAMPNVNPDLLDQQLDAYNLRDTSETMEARLAQTQTDLVDAEITQVRARQLPIFNLAASIYQTPTQTNTNRFEMQTILFAGINGTWNIFDRDATITNVRALQARKRIINSQLRSSTTSRALQLKALTRQIRAACQFLELRRAHLENARRTLQNMRHQFSLEMVTQLDVENAEMNVATLEHDIYADQVNLASAYYQFCSGIEQDASASLYTAPKNE